MVLEGFQISIVLSQPLLVSTLLDAKVLDFHRCRLNLAEEPATSNISSFATLLLGLDISRRYFSVSN